MTVLRVRVVGGDRQLARNELSVPSDWTVAQLASLLRRGLSAGAETSVAISLGGFGALLPPHQPLSSVHLAHARGGVLEVTYATSTQSIELSDILSSPADDLSSTQSAPHPLPEGQQGADISACTYLNRGGRRDDDAMAAVRPSNGGRVPRVVYAVLTLDMCAVGLVIPLLPTYCRMLGGDAAFAGVLQASYGLAQVAGASLLGGLSDRVGRRLILLLSLSGAIAGYAVIALSVRARASVWWLLLSRLPIGLTKQTVAVTRAMVSDCTILSTRAPALGRLAAAGGLGFVFGPAIGGILSAAISPLAPPLVAVGCFTLGLLLVATCLPETVPAVLAQSEFRACERAARELLEASARAHALNTCARTYARGGGDGSSGADGLGAFLARTAPVPLSGTDGSLLPVDSAEAIGRDAIRSWRADAPAAPLLRAADLDAALDVWARVLGQRASADGLVTSGECVAELERLYTQAKQAKGLLPSAPAEGALGRAPAPRSTAAAARTELTTSLCSIVRELRARPLLTELCAVRLLAEMAVLLVHNTFPSYADVRARTRTRARTRPRAHAPLAHMQRARAPRAADRRACVRRRST